MGFSSPFVPVHAKIALLADLKLADFNLIE